MADDLEIDFDKMSLWTTEQATAYFESGGEDVPGETPPAPPPAAPLPKASDELIKQWFPKIIGPADGSAPKFRIVCFHNAGSSETVYSGKGMRQTTENPFVLHCKEKGGELLCVQLPGRDSGRNLPRMRSLPPYAEALFPVLAPMLQDEKVPYMFVSHSMGTWFSYEFIKLLGESTRVAPLHRLTSHISQTNTDGTKREAALSVKQRREAASAASAAQELTD